MKILNDSTAWLSNFEVYDLLKRQKEKREKLHAEIKHPPRTAGNILTIEFETLSYLKNTDCAHLSEAKVTELMEYLLPLKLTKAEKLQIINLLPRSPVDFYLIVEECDERFEAEKIEEIIEAIQRIANLPQPEEAIAMEE